MFITAVPITKLFAGGGGGVESGGHVLRETTSRGQCELVCPSGTNERGGEGYCVKGGGEEEGERERERAGRVRHESSSAKKFGLGKPVVHLELVKFLGL